MLVPETHHESHELIGVGPNMQLRADGIGRNLVSVLEKQAEALATTVRLYRSYRDECRQRQLRVKLITADAILGVGRSKNPVSPPERRVSSLSAMTDNGGSPAA